MSAYIIEGKRSPLGSFLGALSQVPAPKLASTVIDSIFKEKADLKNKVDEVLIGNVLSAGLGQAPARQAAIFAGLNENIPCVTLNKVCGSGLKTIIDGVRAINSGDSQLIVAGGMENMSLAPHLIPGSRQGQKFGEWKAIDSMQSDGLFDVYSQRVMGLCAEECAEKYSFSREAQDEFSIESFKKAQQSIQKNEFSNEIVPIIIKDRKGEKVIDQDEGPFKANFDKIPKLKAVFKNEGTITAANASTINDGAAACLIGGEEYKNEAKFKIIGYGSHAQNPTWFTTAPVQAMKNAIQNAQLSLSDIDAFEINEAFAVVTMAAIKELELDSTKVNMRGGAISLGHPLGCSGTRIVVTLMNILESKNLKYGMASLCIGGGEGLALIIENLKV